MNRIEALARAMGGDPGPEGASAWRVVLTRAAAALVVVSLAIFLLSRGCAERRAVEELAPTERLALFQHTRDDFEKLCVPKPSDALERRCREESLFLVKFPECDERCRVLVDTAFPPASK